MRRAPPPLQALALAVGAGTAAMVARGLIVGFDHGYGPSLTNLPALILVTVFAGRRWGTATLLATLLLGLVWPSDIGGDGPAAPFHLLYVLSGAATVWAAGALRDTVLALDDARLVQENTRLALAESERRLRLAQEAGGVGFWDFDMSTGHGHWSPAVYQTLGLAADLPVSIANFAAVVHPEDRGQIRRMVRQAEAGGRLDPSEYRIVRPDGEVRWMLSRGDIIPGQGGEPARAVGVNIDVTERRRAEAQVRESEARFRALADSAPILMWVSQPGGRREFVNRAYCDFLGDDFEAALVFDWRTRLHADDLDRILAEQVAGESSQAPFTLEARYLRADGAWRWLHSISRPRLAPDGGFRGFIGVAFDVTEARQAQADLERINELLAERVEAALAERDQAEAALRHAQKLEAVGQLTGGVAHDFNNLLTVVIGALDLAQRRPDDVERRDRMIEAALAAARRGGQLTHQLLAFARRQPLTPQLHRIDDLIAQGEPLLRRAAGDAVPLSFRLEAGEAVCRIDGGQFDAALMNLVVNARDAVSQGGAVSIETQVIDAREGDLDGAPAGRYVQVSVTDTGVGMDAETRARIFEPFFTTKAVGKGTGLGLSQAYGFARQSGGSASVDSAPGRGATVRLYLPLAEGATAKAPAAGVPVEAVRPRSLAILLVEDDPDVAHLTEEMLRALGHEVRRCDEASAALRRMEAGEAFDLLISDVVMPGALSGVDLARAVQALRPDLPILLCSGYAGAAALDAENLPWPLLRKPFVGEDLAKAVAQVIGQGAADFE